MAVGEIKDPPMGTNQPTNQMGSPFTQESVQHPRNGLGRVNWISLLSLLRISFGLVIWEDALWFGHSALAHNLVLFDALAALLWNLTQVQVV